MTGRGSGHPFGARLRIGVLQQRDFVLGSNQADPRTTKDVAIFDRIYDPLARQLEAMLDDGEEFLHIWREHRALVESPLGVAVNRNSVRLPPAVDNDLDLLIGRITGYARRALGLIQLLAGKFRTPIGFLFQKESEFAKGLSTMRNNDPDLAAYLEAVRSTWSESLVNLRNDIEHEGWTLPRVRYTTDRRPVAACEPEIDGVPATNFVRATVNRVLLFAEESLAYSMQSVMPDVVVLEDLPAHERAKFNGVRLRPVLHVEGVVRWELRYSETTDFL